MTTAEPDHSLQQILAITEAEARAIESGETEGYFALLSDDAVFLPPNVASKTGDALRQWLRDFVEKFKIDLIEFVHGETWIRGDLACHEYLCRWTATPRSGGASATLAFKGMHVLRRQGDQWKICRNIWNADPLEG